MKSTVWTREVFPNLARVDYDDLVDYPSTDDYPEYPSDFPVEAYVYTTGTVKRKIVKFSKEDLMYNAKTIGALIFEAYGEEEVDNSLLIAGGRNYISGLGANILKMYTRRANLIYADEWLDRIEHIKRRGPYDVIYGAQIILTGLLEKLDQGIFSEEVTFVNMGDVLYQSIVEYWNEKIRALGDYELFVFDQYGASEVSLIASSKEYKKKKLDLSPHPEMAIHILEKDDGKRINALKAKVGDRGRLLLTPLYTFVIPNYRIGDVIEIIGFAKNGLPYYRVLGKDLRKVSLKHPKLGVLEGYTAPMFKVFAVPVNIVAIDRMMARFKTKYLLLVKREGNKALFELYTEKKISKEAILQQMKADVNLFPIYEVIQSDLADLEIHEENLSFVDIFTSNWTWGHIKIPRVIFDPKIIELPSLVPP